MNRYGLKQVGDCAENDVHVRTRALIGKDDGYSPALVSNRPSDLAWGIPFGNCINGNVKRIASCCANFLHNILVAVVEYFICTEAPDMVKVLWRSSCYDMEATKLGELDGVLANG